MTADLAKDIAAWDGKSAEDIGGIYERHRTAPSFVETIVQLARQPAHQNGGTWLLKRHLEDGARLDTKSTIDAYRAAPSLERWEPKLHLLQCIPYMPIPPSCKPQVEAFLRLCLTDEAKFVRAWAYWGFYELALQFPEPNCILVGTG